MTTSTCLGSTHFTQIRSSYRLNMWHYAETYAVNTYLFKYFKYAKE
jgi:hypothetical protein